MGEKDLSSVVIQWTMSMESDEASMEKSRVWAELWVPLLALARYQIEVALPYWDAVTCEAKRCAQHSWKEAQTRSWKRK